MREQVCDLWQEPADAKCITTNGYIKTNGALVMGAGVAGQAQERYPKFPKVAGDAVRKHGNVVHAFHSKDLVPNTMHYPDEDKWFITFPVKHVWYEKADLELIKRSAAQLIDVIDLTGWEKVLLPRPGCGNGQLSWDDVKPAIAPILDDRVVVVDYSLESMLAEDAS